MKILVIGRNPMGHNWVAAAGRAWSTTPRLVEVVDIKAGDYIKTIDVNGNVLHKDDHAPCLDGDDPPPVATERLNGITGKMDIKLIQDPDRIGRKTYEELGHDGRITIKQTDAVGQEAADAAVASARLEVSRLAAENVDLRARIAELEAGKDLRAALSENAELKAMIEAQTAPTKSKTKGSAKEAAAGG